MDSYIALAELASKSHLTDRAFSALPDAPVLPVRAPRRGLVAVRAAARALLRPWPTPRLRRARHRCASTA